MKQDMNGVRTAQDLERKYNLSQNIPQIGELQKNYELQKNGLNKVENELTNFAKATTKNLEDIQNQVDGNITTWFSSGIPSLNNYPTNEWTTNDEKNNHLGDLYYNKETGYAYRFTVENDTYKWIDIKDTDVTKALALANSAKDTADKKRQVFVVEPIPPYDCGDLWIKNEELYRCQTTKGSGETFEDNDWIIATKYTDDTVANQVGQNLTILSGTVTEIRNDVDELNTTMTNTTKLVDEQGNTIGILEQKQSETSQTVDSISTQVSSVEKGLATTNSNLEQTNKDVSALDTKINGVSADFNDFKDNEYINSISNLQDQIDGAIQFWNGAEIPTVNNYPANEWLTENDKNNHRADIYTVIQDVDGEMKQGKSYRFDKVNNTWQWIELTDNELSAVQAIAQDALNKANANTADIGNIKKSVSTLEQTDEQIKANVTSITNQIIPTAQKSGSNIHLEDSSDNKLINLEIEGKSTQETSVQNGNLFDENYYHHQAVYDTGVYKSTLSRIKGNRVLYIKAELKSGKTAQTGVYACLSSTINPNISGSKFWWFINNGKASKTACDFTGYEDLYFDFYPTTTSLDTIFDNYNLWVSTDDIDYILFVSDKPSPDYSSEIKSVGYENLFDGALEQGAINESTGAVYVANTRLRSVNFNKIKSKTTYTFNFVGTGAYEIIEYDNNKNFVQVSGWKLNNTNFTTSAITSFFKVMLRNGNNVIDINEYSNVQVEKGTIVHPYIPFGKYGVEVVNAGKNKFNYLEYNYANSIFSAYRFVEIKKLKPNTTYAFYNYDGSALFSNKINCTAVYLTRSPNYSGVTSNGNVMIFSSNVGPPRNNVTFTTDVTGKCYLGIYCSKTWTEEIWKEAISYFKEAMFTEGKEQHAYEPHKLSAALFVLNDPLRSLPNEVKDIAYIKNNKLYAYRKIKSAILNGSEVGFDYDTNNDAFFYTGFNKVINKPVNNSIVCVMSNYFKGESANNCLKSNYNYCLGFNTLGNLWFKYTDFKTVEEFKAWLSTHNVEVQYELAEPIIEELGEIEMLSTYKNITNITTTTDELEPILNIEYVRNTNVTNYVEGQLNSYNTMQEQKFAEQKITTDGITNKVSYIETSLSNDYTKNNELNQKLEEQKQQIINSQETLMTQNKNAWALEVIQKLNSDGIEKLKNTLVSIDLNGLNVSKSDEDIVSLLNNLGLYVSDGKLKEDLSNLLMKADRTGAYFKIIEILATIREQGIIQKEKINDDKYGICQAWYWIGG